MLPYATFGNQLEITMIGFQKIRRRLARQEPNLIFPNFNLYPLT